MNAPLIRAGSFCDLVLSLRCRFLVVYHLFIGKYSNSQHEICKTLFEVLYAVIQKQFHVIYNDPIQKKKLRLKVLPIGLEWNKRGRAGFPKLKITLVS